MDDVSHVLARAARAQVGVLTEEHRAIGDWNALRGEPLLCQHSQRHLIDSHRAERPGMVTAATRILVDPIDQLLHGGLPVADDRRRMTPRGRHDLAAHHEHAVVGSRHKPLDHDGRFLLAGHLPGLLHLLAGGEIDRHAAALIAVARLDHHRPTDLLGHTPRIGGIAHGPPFRHRDAGFGEQGAGEFLVLGDRFGHGTGAVGFRRDDSPLLGALSQPDERSIREPSGRNPTGRGGLHDRSRARPQLHVEQHFLQPLQFVGDVEWGVVDSGRDQAVCRVQAVDPKRLLLVFDHDLVDAAGIGLPRPTVANGRAGERLQFERDVFEHVPHPRAGPQPFKETATFADRATVLDHRWQPGHDPVVEPGQRVGWEIFKSAQVNAGFEDGKRCPLVRAAQGPERGDFHRERGDLRRERSDLHMNGLRAL